MFNKKEYQRKRYLANREKFLNQSKERYKLNQQDAIEYARKRRAEMDIHTKRILNEEKKIRNKRKRGKCLETQFIDITEWWILKFSENRKK